MLEYKTKGISQEVCEGLGVRMKTENIAKVDNQPINREIQYQTNWTSVKENSEEILLKKLHKKISQTRRT